MPNVVLKQRSRSHKLVFVQLYLDSDEHGEALLNADDLSAKLRISRRGVYNSLLFLKRVNLLKVLEERRGRGRHSLVKLLWLKSGQKFSGTMGAASHAQEGGYTESLFDETSIVPNQSEAVRAHKKAQTSTRKIGITASTTNSVLSASGLEKSSSSRSNLAIDLSHSTPDEKCAGLSIKDIKTTYLRYDRASSLNDRILSQRQRPIRKSQIEKDPRWDRKMRVFRELLEKSWPLPYEQRICTAVLGRYIKNKSTEFSRALYEQLAKIIQKLDAPNWVHQVKDLCKWFMGVITGLARARGLGAAYAAAG